MRAGTEPLHGGWATKNGSNSDPPCQSASLALELRLQHDALTRGRGRPLIGEIVTAYCIGRNNLISMVGSLGLMLLITLVIWLKGVSGPVVRKRGVLPLDLNYQIEDNNTTTQLHDATKPPNPPDRVPQTRESASLASLPTQTNRLEHQLSTRPPS